MPSSTTLIARTPRLLLRQFEPTDAAAMGPIMADPEVMRYSVSGSMDATAVAAWLERIADSYSIYGFGHWAVVRLEDERLLGFCGLSLQTLDDGRHVEIGYRLACDAWGQGFGTEAARAARDYGFQQLGLDRLIAIIDPANFKSQRVAAKLGMKPLRDALYYGRVVQVFGCQRDGDQESNGTG